MSEQATRWIVSRRGMEDADSANEHGQTKLGAHEALMVMAYDYDALRERCERLELAVAAVHMNRHGYHQTCQCEVCKGLRDLLPGGKG